MTKCDKIQNQIRNYPKIEELPVDYTEEQAIKDNCVIIGHTGTINKEILDGFIENIKNNKSDKIRMILYTTEGDMCIRDEEYNSDGTFNVVEDFTRDKFGSMSIKEDTYKVSGYKIYEEEYNSYNYIFLEDPSIGHDSAITICSYWINWREYNPNMELIFEKDSDLEINKIISKDEIEKYHYNVYSFGGNVKVKVEGEIIELREALLQSKIDMSDIMHKCLADETDNKIETYTYTREEDGGTNIYKYEDYWIIKCNMLNGNRDVYIGVPNMDWTGETVKLAK